jgi:hypothetical protein
MTGVHDYGSLYEDVGAMPTDIKIAKSISIFFSATTYVSSVYYIAPSKKRITSLVFTILFIIFCIACIIANFNKILNGYYWWVALYLIACIGTYVGYTSLPSEGVGYI